MEEMAVLIPIFSVIGVFTMIIYLRRYTNMERMSMIEKGVNPEIFNSTVETALWPLRFALLLMGAGIGLLSGYFLDQQFGMKEAAYFSMILLFGGLGLLASYLIEERKSKKR